MQRTKILIASDYKGWTALHHAAIQDDEKSLHALISAGANLSLKNHCGGRPEHLYKHSHLPVTNEMDILLHYTDEDDEGASESITVPLTQVTFHEITRGYTFTNDVYMNAKYLIIFWLMDNTTIEQFCSNNGMADSYIVKNMPKTEPLQPKKLGLIDSYTVRELDSTETIFENTDWMLISEENISTGKFITYYPGEYVDLSDLDNIQTLAHTKILKQPGYITGNGPLKRRGIAGYAPSGAPNTTVIHYPNLEGMILKPILVAITDITAGEPIRLYLDPMNITRMAAHHELAPHVFQDFDFDEPPSMQSYGYDVIYKAECFEYAVSTPIILVKLFLHEKIELDTIKELVSEYISHKPNFSHS